MSTETNKKKAGINIDEIMDVTQYTCFSSSHQIILLGRNDKHQGIYIYIILIQVKLNYCMNLKMN